MPRFCCPLVLCLLGPTIVRVMAQEAPPQSAESLALELPELRRELLERRERDSSIRNRVIRSGAENPDPALAAEMRKIDHDNTVRMKEIVREHGWPGPELVGRDGTSAAWLLVQHSTPEFQKEMLPLVKEAFLAKKLPGSNYALLLDRVLVHEGKPQLYGSQGKWKNGVLDLHPIADEANVDQRRAEVGLGPLDTYLKGMRERYGSKSTTGAANAQKQERTLTLPRTDFAQLDALEKSYADAMSAVRAATDPKEAAAKRTEASRLVAQLAWARSTAGDYAGALEVYRSISSPADGGSSRVDHTAKARELVQGYRPRDAIAAIVEAARDRQVVILNEAHHVARHRAFALLLALELRRAGFQYLACETFISDLDKTELQSRGYPRKSDGFYVREPLFADFVRQSLKAGYIPIAYEHSGRRSANATPADSINERETGQATNLVERIFKQDPLARVFVYFGFSQLMKKPQNRAAQPDRTVQWMAGRLKAMTGIDPLTIDQVAMTDPEETSLHGTLLQDVFAGPELKDVSAVVMQGVARENFLVLGSYAGDAGMQVFHRPTTWVNGRPDWLALNGRRTPRPVPEQLIPPTGRRLVQAFVANEEDQPIAVDQFIVEAGAATIPTFMLPPGNFRFAFEE